ncbi:hypothetical protein [Luteococcus peritonei]|uniref:DUF1707 domain-containing protein n=1 Tax=Luteococcus peritonei TaxID=88874 RepID=A0ABW4RV91_9ACTN
MTSQTNSSGDAVARYQYLLRTASPDQIEQAHEQAFAQVSAAERQQVLQALSTTGETPADASAASLARSATRLEVQQPGTLQSVLGQAQGAIGGSTGRNLLTSVAGGFIGSGLFSMVTGGDGVGGRPGLLTRLLGGGLFGRRAHNQMGMGSFGGLRQQGGMGGGFGRLFGGGGNGGPGGGFGGPGGGFGGPGGGGPGGGPGGF